MDKIREYIKKFIDKLGINEYIGIIAYGSYVSGRSDKLSDLDIMIIKKDYATSDIGSIMIDGIRVEFFIQDLKRLYELVKKEIEGNDPSHLTKFATCEIVCDETGEIKEFIDYCKKIYDTTIKKSFDEKDKFEIFSINNRLEDLESSLNDETFYAIYYVLLERIRNAYCKINGLISVPLTKIERIYTDENYSKNYISSDKHRLPDEEFVNLYLQCLKIDARRTMLDRISKLYRYSFESYDFDPTNFHIKFKEAPFRV